MCCVFCEVVGHTNPSLLLCVYAFQEGKIPERDVILYQPSQTPPATGRAHGQETKYNTHTHRKKQNNKEEKKEKNKNRLLRQSGPLESIIILLFLKTQ